MKLFEPLKQLVVSLDFGEGEREVGRLARRGRQLYFEYNNDFVNTKLQISPFHLPLETGVKTFEPELFEGLPGVFNDSLPDGWGRLLFDRLLRTQNRLPRDVSPLDRLAYVGRCGMGALSYKPDMSEKEYPLSLDLDDLSRDTERVLEGEADNVLEELFILNGSSAGARPKTTIGFALDSKKIIPDRQDLPSDYTHWIVKFSNTSDGQDAGAVEYVYSLMATKAGLCMPRTYLFPAKHSKGYFATERFDRVGSKRFHTHSACGLLHSDFRIPVLDYEDILTLTSVLTRDVREVEKAYRLAVFNVLSHNRDDHSKNYTFLMNPDGEWYLSPCYDLTFSSGPNGEQSTTVLGEGRAPGKSHLIELGHRAKISRKNIDHILDQTQTALSSWPQLAHEYGVEKSYCALIQKRIEDIGRS